MNGTNSIIHQKILEEQPNICNITVIQNNEILLDESWNGYNETHNAHIMSVTKSIMALLLGIAIDKKYIIDENQRIIDFFPDYETKRGEKTIYDISIKHLLTMTAPYKYKYEPWTKVCSSTDWTVAALDLIGGRKGISNEFKYSTLGIQILGGIIENATGTRLIDFANNYLFAPLDIPLVHSHNDISEIDQREFMLSKLSLNHEWYCDPKGTAVSGWGLSLSSSDMAKVGQLILNDGMYNGKQIISKNWIRKATIPYIKLGDDFGNMSYGFLWWILDNNRIAAIGDGGNIIYVDKTRNITAGITATFKPRIFDRVEYLEKEILPLICN